MQQDFARMETNPLNPVDYSERETQLKSEIQTLRDGLDRFVRWFPMKHGRTSLDGIISYLTKKHGGNVHEKGIVTITSKSVSDDPRFALKNVADLTSDSEFNSKDEPGQWICWDFGEMRVHPTHYTMDACYIGSWNVDGSLNGTNWKQIDDHHGAHDFGRRGVSSFVVWQPMECRFIRLTQIQQNSACNEMLFLAAVEFFGTLSE
jgi:hypothetical protein